MTGKVPKGYKQTEVGVIPAEWEVVAIGNHIDFISGYPFKSDEFSQDSSKTKLLRGINITEGNLRWNPEIDRYWSHVTPELTRYLLDESDLVIGMDGSKVGRNYAQVKSTDLPLLLVQRVARIRCLPSLFVEFLRHFVGSEFFTEYVDSVKTSSGIPHISAKQINEYTIPLPPLPEQKRIAEILSGVDATIESTRKVIDQTKKVKQGLLQELLTKGIGHTKFKDTEIGRIPAEWEVVRLGDMIDISSGFSPSNAALSSNGTIPFFKVNQLNDSSKYLVNSPFWHSDSGLFTLPAGAIIFPKRGASIFTNKIRILGIPGSFDTNLMATVPHESLNNEYLYYWLDSYGLSRIADTSSIPQINNKHISPLKFPLPPLPEQKKIAEILSSVDATIESTRKVIDQTKKVKQGLMQDLLTGKVRVKV